RLGPELEGADQIQGLQRLCCPICNRHIKHVGKRRLVNSIMKKALIEYKEEKFSLNRRSFIGGLSYSIGLTILSSSSLSAFASQKRESNNKKLGIALVGLGGYSGGELAPAPQETEHCYLAGIVTGTPG